MVLLQLKVDVVSNVHYLKIMVLVELGKDFAVGKGRYSYNNVVVQRVYLRLVSL